MAVGFFPERVNETDTLAWWEHVGERRTTGADSTVIHEMIAGGKRWEARKRGAFFGEGSDRDGDDDADNEENSFSVKRKTEEKGREEISRISSPINTRAQPRARTRLPYEVVSRCSRDDDDASDELLARRTTLTRANWYLERRVEKESG